MAGGLVGDDGVDGLLCRAHRRSCERGRGLYARGSSGTGASSRPARRHGYSPLAVSLFADMETGMRKIEGEKGRQGEGEKGRSAFSLSPPLPVSLSHVAANRQCWDVIVIGAGPAGAMAAYELARRSLRVLLVDKSAFPRPKVCGSCLNGQVLALLQGRGLDHVIRGHGAVPLHQVMLAANGHQAVIPLPAGKALSREVLDMGLINAAIESGVTFLSQTRASLNGLNDPGRQVVLESNGNRSEAKAAIVLAADGRRGTLSEAIHARSPRPAASASSRIRAGVIIEGGPTFYQPETIYMACGRGGYVGLVRLEDDRLNLAAAFDLKSLRETGHAGRLASKILHEAGFPAVPDLADMPCKGTPPLTHHARGLATG